MPLLVALFHLSVVHKTTLKFSHTQPPYLLPCSNHTFVDLSHLHCYSWCIYCTVFPCRCQCWCYYHCFAAATILKASPMPFKAPVSCPKVIFQQSFRYKQFGFWTFETDWKAFSYPYHHVYVLLLSTVSSTYILVVAKHSKAELAMGVLKAVRAIWNDESKIVPGTTKTHIWNDGRCICISLRMIHYFSCALYLLERVALYCDAMCSRFVLCM